MWQGGEQPLPKHGACNLCSINVSEYVLDPWTDNARIDYISLRKDLEEIVSEMDKILEENLSRHALPEQREMAQKYRNIGIGIMGLADLFVKLGIKYGSDDSVGISSHLMRFIFREAVKVSATNGRIYGNFPGYSPKVWDSTIIRNAFDEEEIAQLKEQNTLRNCSLLSIAPTGSIGTMLNISTGVEPFFALSYNRRTESMSGETYKVEIKAVEEYRKAWHNNKDLPGFFVTSSEIPWKDRINIQAALQRYCDTAISSTVNLPKETTIDNVKQLYIYAWEKGLKGVTIYREGSRYPILSTESTKEEKISEQVSLNTENAKLQLEAKHELKRGEIVKTGDHWLGLKRTLTTGCGTLHCEAFFDPNTGELRECYLSKGSTGGCNNFMIGLSRMISLAARGGLSIEAILDQLKSCGVCPSYAVRQATKKDVSKGSCCPVAVGNALKDMYEEIQEIICECKSNEAMSISNDNKKSIISNEYIELSDIPKKEGQSYTEVVKEYIQSLKEENESLNKRIQEVYIQTTGSFDPHTGKTWAQIFKEREQQENNLEECPNCHEKTLIHQGGCVSCPSCSYTKCD